MIERHNRPSRMASRRRQSRWSGCAIAISALARSRIDRPRSSATPYSVTTLSTVFFSVVTTSPAGRKAVAPHRPVLGRLLLHHCRVDDDGIVQWANLVIATRHNNLAMNRSVLQVAKRYVKSAALTESMLNRVEAVIRCHDPCFPATHALGELALHLQLIGPNGSVLDELVQ
jgi:hypothetical protein